MQMCTIPWASHKQPVCLAWFWSLRQKVRHSVMFPKFISCRWITVAPGGKSMLLLINVIASNLIYLLNKKITLDSSLHVQWLCVCHKTLLGSREECMFWGKRRKGKVYKGDSSRVLLIVSVMVSNFVWFFPWIRT